MTYRLCVDCGEYTPENLGSHISVHWVCDECMTEWISNR